MTSAAIALPWMLPLHREILWLLRATIAIALLTGASLVPWIRWKWIPSIAVDGAADRLAVRLRGGLAHALLDDRNSCGAGFVPIHAG